MTDITDKTVQLTSKDVLREVQAELIKIAASLVQGVHIPTEFDEDNFYKSTPVAERRRIRQTRERLEEHGRVTGIKLRDLFDKLSPLIRSSDETSEHPYSRTTDIAMQAFFDRWQANPVTASDQQWVNGYARALQHVRSKSVPSAPKANAVPTRSDIQSRQLYTCPVPNCPGNHLSKLSVCVEPCPGFITRDDGTRIYCGSGKGHPGPCCCVQTRSKANAGESRAEFERDRGFVRRCPKCGSSGAPNMTPIDGVIRPCPSGWHAQNGDAQA